LTESGEGGSSLAGFIARPPCSRPAPDRGRGRCSHAHADARRSSIYLSVVEVHACPIHGQAATSAILKGPCPLGRKRRPIGPKRRPLGVRQGPFRDRIATLLRTPSGHRRKWFSALESQIEDGRKSRFCEGEERYWLWSRSICLALMSKVSASSVGFSVSRQVISSPPDCSCPGRLIPSRSIRGRDLIHRFRSRPLCPPLAGVASLPWLMPRTPARAGQCAANRSRRPASGFIARTACGAFGIRLMACRCRRGPRLIHFFEAGRRRLAPRSDSGRSERTEKSESVALTRHRENHRQQKDHCNDHQTAHRPHTAIHLFS
jgi:hypothetical protein